MPVQLRQLPSQAARKAGEVQYHGEFAYSKRETL